MTTLLIIQFDEFSACDPNLFIIKSRICIERYRSSCLNQFVRHKITRMVLEIEELPGYMGDIRYATMKAIVERNTIVLRQTLKFNAIIPLA